MPLTTTIVNMAGVPPLPDIQQNRVKLVTAVVRVIARLQQQEAAMPASLRRLCVQIRAECLVRMERDHMKHDEYDALPKGLNVARLLRVIVPLMVVRMLGDAAFFIFS